MTNLKKTASFIAIPLIVQFVSLESRSEEKLPLPAPAPYSVPWQLRPVLAPNVVRLDSAIAFYKDKNGNSGGLVAANMLTGAYKIRPDWAALMRIGMANNSPPAGASGATSFTNPLLGGIYSIGLSPDFRMSLFFGLTLPIGSGGGNSPDPAVQSANSAAILARSAMDNALFAVNYLTVIPGASIAYIAKGWTLQLEATILQLTRIRGEQIDLDPARTNLTSGFLAGYSVHPNIFVEGELRYQRWLNNPTVFSSMNPAKENLSFAIGPRFSFQAGSLTVKPGIAYMQGLAGPMASSGHQVLFLDIPVFY